MAWPLIPHVTEIDAEPLNDLATLVGIDGLGGTESHEYLLSNPLSIDPGHLHTPACFSGGSDGNLIYRDPADHVWKYASPDTAGVVAKTGDQTIGGIKTFSSIPLGPASDPTTVNQLTRKAYVDLMLPLAGGILSGALGINMGATAPTTKLEVVETIVTSPRGVMSAQYSTSSDGARFHARKARGTLVSPTVIVTGDTLGRLVASGYDGSSYLEMAAISFIATGTIAANRVPTYISFFAATDASPSAMAERVRITSTGMGINCVPTEQLDVGGKITLSSNIVGRGTTYLDIYMNTTDGSDTKALRFGGGGDLIQSRGAYVALNGNENASNPGKLFLRAGDVNANMEFTVYGSGHYLFALGASGNIGIGVTALGTSAAKALGLASGTAPTTFPADMAQMCVKDQAAGNACFHFFTEGGAIIKLYQQTALTTELTAITYTAPGTPDYALQDLVQNTGFGFATKDEGNTLLSAVKNLQTRVAEIATRLANCGLTA